MRSSNGPTVIGNVATHKEDMRDGPASRLAADEVCSPDTTFCDLRKSNGNGLLLGIGHMLEEGVRTSIIGQPLERLELDCTPAAQTLSVLTDRFKNDRLLGALRIQSTSALGPAAALRNLDCTAQ